MAKKQRIPKKPAPRSATAKSKVRGAANRNGSVGAPNRIATTSKTSRTKKNERERLAADELVRVTPSNKELLKLAKKKRPPAAWFKQDEPKPW